MSDYFEELEDLDRPAKRRRMMAHDLDQTLVEAYYNVFLDMFLRCKETFSEDIRDHEALPDNRSMLTPSPEPLLIKDRFVAEYQSYYPEGNFDTQMLDLENFETQPLDLETQVFNTVVDQLLIVDCLAQLEQM